MRLPIHALALVAMAFAGCQYLPLRSGSHSGSDAPVQRATPPATEPVLYARDGSIVTPAGSPSAALPRRDMQGGDGSRAKILELYQRVVDERDRLQLTLAERDGEVAMLRKQLDAQTLRATEFETRMRSAEQSTAELSTQNLELASRLTTAQIRRLEAERNWLELQVALPSKTIAASLNNPPAAGREKTTPATLRPAGPVKPTETPPVKDARPIEHH